MASSAMGHEGGTYPIIWKVKSRCLYFTRRNVERWVLCSGLFLCMVPFNHNAVVVKIKCTFSTNIGWWFHRILFNQNAHFTLTLTKKLRLLGPLQGLCPWTPVGGRKSLRPHITSHQPQRQIDATRTTYIQTLKCSVLINTVLSFNILFPVFGILVSKNVLRFVGKKKDLYQFRFGVVFSLTIPANEGLPSLLVLEPDHIGLSAHRLTLQFFLSRLRAVEYAGYSLASDMHYISYRTARHFTEDRIHSAG